MDNHIIAISTYGSHRVKYPHTGNTVSAYKLGYTSATRDVLLALYGKQAQDVSSKQASYHYMQIHAEVTVRHGYILLKVSDDELTRAESVTIQNPHPTVYRWLEGAWQEFPNNRSDRYQPVSSYNGPNFNPTGMLIVSASTGEAEAAITGITAEKSQRSDNDTPWWWLRGDTYPHRDLLKRWGCRWSNLQKAWYYIGKSLPNAVQTLIDAQPDDAPCSDEEAAAILGVELQPKPQPETPRLYALNATVYARHDLLAPDGKHIPTGTRGTITQLYNRNPSHGWSYDVAFEDIGTGWYFERELSNLTPIPGIRITHGAVVPSGAVMPPTDAEIKAQLIESGHLSEPIESGDTSEDAEIPRVRVIKPMSNETELDSVISAIRQTKAESLPVLQSSATNNGKRSLVRIPQTPCGELTGSITGSVWCYGYAVYEGVCIYLNMGGPRMAAEAIRAKLAKGDIVSCVPWDAASIELTAGEGNMGMYTAFTQNIPEAKFTSLILLHELVTQPNYGGKSTTFILHVNDEQAMAQLHQHVTKLVNVPVFAAWTGYLWQAGHSAMLVRKTRGAGGLDVLAVDLDIDAWTRLITGGLSEKIIQLPQNT
jgi:hypothetical protein